MDYYLPLAQTIFYAVFSLAILIFAIVLGIAAYYLVIIARHLRKITENVAGASGEVKEHLRDLLESIAGLPLISMLFKHRPKSRRDGHK